MQLRHSRGRDAFGLEHRALFDMQFDERVWRRTWHWRRTRVADALKFLADQCVVDAGDGERGLDSHAADIDQAAQHVGRKPGAFLVGEERDGECAMRNQSSGLHGLDDLEPSEHPKVAVVAATGADGIDVRTAHDRRPVDLAGHDAHCISNGIDRDLKAQVAHPGDNQIATELVVVGERQAR